MAKAAVTTTHVYIIERIYGSRTEFAITSGNVAQSGRVHRLINSL